MLIENPLPGLPGWDEIAGVKEVWHINFHQAPTLPEVMIRGHEATYFRSQFFGQDVVAVDDTELARYSAAYALPAQLEAGLGQYRATDQNAAFNQAAARAAVSVPLTLVATEGSLGPTMVLIETALESGGWTDVDRITLPGHAHYLMDEFPVLVTDLIIAAAKQ